MLEEHHSWEILVLFCKGWYRLTCASQAQATSASDIYWKNIWQHSEAVFQNIYYWINDVSAWLILTHISLLKIQPGSYGYFPLLDEKTTQNASALELGFKHTVIFHLPTILTMSVFAPQHRIKWESACQVLSVCRTVHLQSMRDIFLLVARGLLFSSS